MSIVGIFTQSQASIGGIYFDAVLEESSELQTDVTEFPIEDGSVGNDHAVRRPLRLTMTVGVSDNPFRVLRARASAAVGGSGWLASAAGNLAGIGAGVGIGAIAGRLSGETAALAGIAAGAANMAGQAATHSMTVLEQVRALQRANAIISVVTAKGPVYDNCLITRTYQRTTKQNEGGLELVVEMQQLQIINSTASKIEIPALDDTATTQGQRHFDMGEVTPA